MLSYPGVFTATKEFGDLCAVLPPACAVSVVGGVVPSDIATWRAAKFKGFGRCTALYAIGMDVAEAALLAKAAIIACDACA